MNPLSPRTFAKNQQKDSRGLLSGKRESFQGCRVRRSRFWIFEFTLHSLLNRERCFMHSLIPFSTCTYLVIEHSPLQRSLTKSWSHMNIKWTWNVVALINSTMFSSTNEVNSIKQNNKHEVSYRITIPNIPLILILMFIHSCFILGNTSRRRLWVLMMFSFLGFDWIMIIDVMSFRWFLPLNNIPNAEIKEISLRRSKLVDQMEYYYS